MSKKMKIVVTVPKEMEGLSVEMVIDENYCCPIKNGI